jgi:hypothetical protein
MRNPFANLRLSWDAEPFTGLTSLGDDIRKPVWMWVAEGEDAYDAANSLRPWLSAVRRVQLERVFRAEA